MSQRNAFGYYRRLFGGQFPRRVYGNDAGLANNVLAERELRRLRRIVPAPVEGTGIGSWARASALQLHRDGWVKLGSDASAPTLAHIRSRYDELIADPATSIDLGTRPRADAVRHVIDPLGQVPELAALFTADVADVARLALGTELAVTSVRLWRTIHIPHEDLVRQGRLRHSRPVSVMANLFHNDEHPVTTLKYFVQLTPNMSVDRGALQLVPIKATKRIVRSGFLRPDAVFGTARQLLERTDDIVVFDGPPGSGLLCNSERCLHRAGIPEAGSERAMIQFTLVPAAVPFSIDWAQQIAPDREVARI